MLNLEELRNGQRLEIGNFEETPALTSNHPFLSDTACTSEYHVKLWLISTEIFYDDLIIIKLYCFLLLMINFLAAGFE